MHVVILAAANHPLREPFAGGLESLSWELVHGLRGRGVRVTLFAGEGSDPALDCDELRVRPLELSAVARGDVSMPPERWLREHHAYLQVLLELQARHDVDVIHNNSLHYLPVAMAATLSAPMVTTLHTPPTPWLEPAVRVARAPASTFVAVSRHTSQAWRHVVPTTVVHNGIDVRRWAQGPGGQDLVWVGRMVAEKAPHLAIDIARASGRRVCLAGPVSDPDYFDRQVRPRLGLHAEYVGHLGTTDLSALVGSSAATLVTPVWDEPYGLVAAESLACGTPVVAFDRGGLSEFVTPEVGVLVPGGDVEAAAAGVDRAVGLSRAGCRAHALLECSVDRMIEDYLRIYTSVSAVESAA